MPIYSYHSNKLEYLIEILIKFLNIKKQNIFTPTKLIVNNLNIKDWLSIKLAENGNIAMNIEYDTLNSYILNISYAITNKNKYKKLYSKDILIWRIFNKLDNIVSDEPREYYQKNLFKKYKLSIKLANIFIKYITYRPYWLEKWEKNNYIFKKNQNNEKWQMEIWQMLIKEINEPPYKVQSEAILKLSKNNLNKINMLNDIYIFGINNITPENFKFMFELSKYINIIFLYMNPCNEDVFTLNKDKLSDWLNNNNYEKQSLLDNFGKYNKEFLSQLLKIEQQNIKKNPKFNKKIKNFKKISEIEQTQLISIQRNLLNLNHKNYAKKKDSSIIINSCYTPLRELEVLNDSLLNFIKKDPRINCRDILVISPNLKDYLPYIDIIFSESQSNTKLSYTIADNILLDTQPLISNFIEILDLPEYNFEINKIMEYLSISAIQKKFKIFNENLETIRFWLKETSIHNSNNGKVFSWSWGLKRLILGFSYSDKNYIINNKLMTIPIIEDSDIVLFGKLYELIEFLEESTKKLKKSKSIISWKDCLLELFDNLFLISEEEEYIAKKIKDTILNITNLIENILPEQNIDLNIIKDCLINELSKVTIKKNFLNGKIIFSSIKSIPIVPFKIICILGLNNDRFPSKESDINFDLITKFDRVIGDKSKKEDDQYLFLEIILSARKYLYLSYIGRNIKTNSKQHPSLILKEFITYLKLNYKWFTSFDEINDKNKLKTERKNIISDIKEYPLHSFDPNCYLNTNKYKSFNKNWLKILNNKANFFYDKKIKNNINYIKIEENFTISKLVKIFDNPIKAYANNSLKLYLEDFFIELIDNEPFDINNLDKYFIKKEVFNYLTNNKDPNLIRNKIKLNGKFPNSIITNIEIDSIIKEVNSLYKIINLDSYIFKYFYKKIFKYELNTNCYINNNEILMVSLSNINIKKKFELYLTALLVSSIEKKDITSIYYFLDKKEIKKFELEKINYLSSKKILKNYMNKIEEIVVRPKLLHLSIIEIIYNHKKKYTKNNEIILEKIINFLEFNIKKDDYLNLFYPNYPTLEDLEDLENEEIYKDFFELIN